MKFLRTGWLISVVLLVGAVLLSSCSGTSGADSSSAPEEPPMLDAVAPNDSAGQTTLVAFDATQTNLEPSTGMDRLIIKNGELRLQVADTNEATARISDIATEYGGYVLGSATNKYSTHRTGSVTLTVEVAYFETALADLQTLAEDVLSVSSTGEDVTAEYVDVEARLRNLEATRDRVRAFMDETQNVEEALAVNAELSRLEGEIEQVKGRMNYLAGRAAYSTITVYLQEAPAESKKSWSLAAIFEDAVDAQGNLLRGLVEFGIWLVVLFGPYFVVIGILLVVWWRWLRRRKIQAPPTEQSPD